MNPSQTEYSVLLIEDNPADARIVQAYLHNNKYIRTHLVHMNTLTKGSQVLNDQKFDVILLDLSLPDAFGIPSISKLRSLTPHKAQNIIVLTGNQDADLGYSALRAGAQDFLDKGNLNADILGKSLLFAIERFGILSLLDETQRQARIGSWKFNKSTQEFTASDMIYELLDINKADTLNITQAVKQQENFALLFDFIQNKSANEYNYQITTSDGNTRHLLIWADPALANHLEINGIVQDITDRLQKEELLREAEVSKELVKMKEQFIANVSHEMRTPMNGILGLTHLLKETSLDTEQQQLIQGIHSSGEILLGVVNDVLDLTAVQQGKLNIKAEAINFREIAKDLEQLALAKIGNKNLKLKWSVSHEIPDRITIDKLRLQQILLNLAGNAIKFAEQGTIEVKFSVHKTSTQTFLEFYVKDEGIGMKKQDLNKIFEPFTRVAKDLGNYEGSGLGLSITSGIIKSMNGEIQVNSTIGKGSTFHVKLPISIPITEEKKHVESTLDTSKLTGRILLVDDHPINRMVAEKSLNQISSRLEIDIATDGAQALKLMELNIYQLVLMDLQMPVMDGYEATLKIKSNSKWNATKVVAMTANAFAEKEENWKQTGFDGIITKPFNFQDLKILLTNILK